MELNIRHSILSRIAGRVNLLVLLCVSLLISNVLLAAGCIYAFSHQLTRYIPFGAERAFSMSSTTVDSSYLTMMAEDVVGLIFNVSPKTVIGSHKLALEMVAPSAYAHFLARFTEDSSTILHNEVASTFYIKSIKANPATMQVWVTGMLHRSVGERTLLPVKKTFLITFSYHGKLLVTSILEQQKKQKAEQHHA